MKQFVFFIGICFLIACNSTSNNTENNAQDTLSKGVENTNTKTMSDFEIFKTYIVGDFDNNRQIEDEKKTGKQIHPFAKHINRICHDKIQNLPQDLKGFFILEESFYKYPDQDTLIKPYLFLFEETEDGKVRLISMEIPKEMDKKIIRNDNQALQFDYLKLKPSLTFKPALYTRTEKGFYTKTSVDLPNNMRFTLEETISDKSLTVMELLEKEGKNITPYDTPILYDRLQ